MRCWSGVGSGGGCGWKRAKCSSQHAKCSFPRCNETPSGDAPHRRFFNAPGRTRLTHSLARSHSRSRSRSRSRSCSCSRSRSRSRSRRAPKFRSDALLATVPDFLSLSLSPFLSSFLFLLLTRSPSLYFSLALSWYRTYTYTERAFSSSSENFRSRHCRRGWVARTELFAARVRTFESALEFTRARE